MAEENGVDVSEQILELEERAKQVNPAPFAADTVGRAKWTSFLMG